MNMAGRMAKYLATSLAIEKVVSAPRVISSCLPISTTSSSLVGIRIQIDHVAGFLGRLRAGVHRHADVGLGQGRRVVRAVAGHGHQLARACSALISRIFIFGRGLGQKIVDAGFVGNRGRRAGIVAGDHHGANPHRPEAGETFGHSHLDHVLEMDDPQHPWPLATASGVPPSSPIRPAISRSSPGDSAAKSTGKRGHGINRPFANRRAIEVATAHSGLG